MDEKFKIDGRKKRKMLRQLKEINDSLMEESRTLAHVQKMKVYNITGDLESVIRQIECQL